MKYAVFIRGINVGGNAIVKMADLRAALEDHGFEKVLTYIQSGNVVVESPEKSVAKVEEKIDAVLTKAFQIPIRVVVVSHTDLKQVLDDVPKVWKTFEKYRCYMAFVKLPTKPADVVAAVKLKEGVDLLSVGEGVVYMSTLLTGLTKSGFTKLVGTPVYKNITIRNYSTVKKLLALMEKV